MEARTLRDKRRGRHSHKLPRLTRHKHGTIQVQAEPLGGSSLTLVLLDGVGRRAVEDQRQVARLELLVKAREAVDRVVGESPVADKLARSEPVTSIPEGN